MSRFAMAACAVMLLVAGVALDRYLLQPASADDDQDAPEIAVRLVARTLHDGRVEVALQQQTGDGVWSEPSHPKRRFAPVAAVRGRWYVSSPVSLTVATDDEHRGSFYCFVSHAAPEGDAFWNLAHAAASDAAIDLGRRLRIMSDPEPEGQARLLRDCIADGATGVVTTLPDAETLMPVVRDAQAAGISVVSVNAGMAPAGSVETDMHIGLRETTSGVLAGKKLTELGVRGVVLCVVHEDENLSLEQRCAGIGGRYWGGSVEALRVADTGTSDLDGTQAVIVERLRSSSVGAVVTLNDRIALAAVDALKEVGADAVVATYGGNPAVFSAMNRGEIAFLIWDQPTIQAYMAVVALSVILEAAEFVAPEIVFGRPNVVIEPSILDRERLAILTAEVSRTRIADPDGTPVFPEGSFVYGDE